MNIYLNKNNKIYWSLICFFLRFNTSVRYCKIGKKKIIFIDCKLLRKRGVI